MTCLIQFRNFKRATKNNKKVQTATQWMSGNVVDRVVFKFSPSPPEIDLSKKLILKRGRQRGPAQETSVKFWGETKLDAHGKPLLIQFTSRCWTILFLESMQSIFSHSISNIILRHFVWVFYLICFYQMLWFSIVFIVLKIT